MANFAFLLRRGTFVQTVQTVNKDNSGITDFFVTGSGNKSFMVFHQIAGAELIGSRTFSKSFVHSIMVTVKETKEERNKGGTKVGQS